MTIPAYVEPDTPLRLAEAAARAFPDGSMTASGLRCEARKGRLDVRRVAGKDYTTLRAIGEMMELCRVEAKVRASGLLPPAGTQAERSPTTRHGSSETGAAKLALDAAMASLESHQKQHSKPLQSTSSQKPRRRASAVVIPLNAGFQR